MNKEVVTAAERDWAIHCGIGWTEEFLRKKKLDGTIQGAIPHWQMMEMLKEAYVIGWVDAKNDGELMRGARP